MEITAIVCLIVTVLWLLVGGWLCWRTNQRMNQLASPVLEIRNGIADMLSWFGAARTTLSSEAKEARAEHDETCLLLSRCKTAETHTQAFLKQYPDIEETYLLLAQSLLGSQASDRPPMTISGLGGKRNRLLFEGNEKELKFQSELGTVTVRRPEDKRLDYVQGENTLRVQIV